VRLPAPPFLLITDRQQAGGSVSSIAEAAFSAGCRWLSLREKDLPPSEQAALLRELLACAQQHQAVVTLHGNATLARDAGARGVHLAAGGNIADARRLLGNEALIGLSIHDADEARAVEATLVDYVIAGPVFATQSKPGYGPVLGPEGVALIAKACPVPVVAIGGVNFENAPDCLTAGAAGVGVMGGVMRADNPADVVA
jgi:thiamine-phosphate pyrophosphorylase